jgi:hypothetical protein
MMLIHDEILDSLKKRWGNNVICDNMDKTGGLYVTFNKPDAKR